VLGAIRPSLRSGKSVRKLGPPARLLALDRGPTTIASATSSHVIRASIAPITFLVEDRSVVVDHRLESDLFCINNDDVVHRVSRKVVYVGLFLPIKILATREARRPDDLTFSRR